MKKWIVDGEEFTTIEDAVQEVLDEAPDLTEAFEEGITDEHGYTTYIEVCDGEFETIELLERLGVYERMYDDWAEDVRRDLQKDIERMNAGDSIERYGTDIECVDDIEKLFADAREALNNIRTAFDALRPIYGGGQANNLNILIEFIDTVEEKVKKEA